MKKENENTNEVDGVMPSWMQEFIRLYLNYEVELFKFFDQMESPEDVEAMETTPGDGMDNLGDMLGIPKDQTCDIHDMKALAREVGLSEDIFCFDICELATRARKWPESVYCRDWLYQIPGEIVDGETTVEEALDDLRIEYGLRNKTKNPLNQCS